MRICANNDNETSSVKANGPTGIPAFKPAKEFVQEIKSSPNIKEAPEIKEDNTHPRQGQSSTNPGKDRTLSPEYEKRRKTG